MERSTAVVAGVALAGVFAIILVAMQRNDPARDPYIAELDNPMVMRVYDVPPERAQDIRSALSTALDNGNAAHAPLGRVTLSGTNQVLVLAPVLTQGTISEAVQKLGGGTSVANGPGSTVRLELWLVDADASSGSDDAALTPIRAALDAARSTLGAVRFRIHDQVTLSALPNGGLASALSGRRTEVEAHMRPISEGVQVELRVNAAGLARLESTSSLKLGETMVLAQLSNGSDAAAGTRLYVLRATSASS